MTEESSTVASAEGVVETQGESVEAAVAAALEQLGIAREEAEIEVLSAGARPVPGERLSGSEAKVRVQRMDPHAAHGRQLLEEMLAKMEIPARVAVRRAPLVPGAEGPAPVILDVSGDDLGLLIGWRGETLRALQTTLNLMLGEEESEGRRLIIDVERYRARREEQVRELAMRLALRVKRSGERYTLDPMQPYERRVVHLALAGDEGVRTESTGREPARRVIIHPTGPAQPDLPGGEFDRDRDRRPRGGRRW